MGYSQGRRFRTGTAMMAACAALAATALAGSRYPPGVSITPKTAGGGMVVGTLGGVRNSASTVEKLSCLVSRTETTSASGAVTRSTAVNCQARDVNGVAASCTSNQEAHAIALNGVSNDSLIEFHYDTAARCTTIWVYESASLQRKGA
jgi:hypothetical protein